jgi:hypothetical protein
MLIITLFLCKKKAKYFAENFQNSKETMIITLYFRKPIFILPKNGENWRKILVIALTPLSDSKFFQPAPPTELWQWVHSFYGEELGLTSGNIQRPIFNFTSRANYDT